MLMKNENVAISCHVKGIVQGVGFRPFVYRIALANDLAGWVKNDVVGVQIHVEGAAESINNFIEDLQEKAPPASEVVSVDTRPTDKQSISGFEIRESESLNRPLVRITPDLCICEDCRREILDSTNRRYLYPYTNCTNCGPRYSIIEALPYDRRHTTMTNWSMCSECSDEYHDPADRRFHAQPNCCPTCGPTFKFHALDKNTVYVADALAKCASYLQEGKIVAIKGIGGFHLACDAKNEVAVEQIRARKFRKEKPFALMAKDLATAQQFVTVSVEDHSLLKSPASPIVLLNRKAASQAIAPNVAPGMDELGIMLPYTPLHVLLFELGAPNVIVLTSANRSNEPIAYTDNGALSSLSEIADAFLIGDRPIARRTDDSVVRTVGGSTIQLRRARGFAPAVVTTFPSKRPILAVGADLKNTVTLVVDGEAVMSPYIGDLEHYEVQVSHEQVIEDLTQMYELPLDEVLVVHDTHPGYISTQKALELPGEKIAIQHHRAHIASVLAERRAWDQTVVGVAFDGTGYGDDGTIWGGEIFVGSLKEGFERVKHLKPAWLPGGDAAVKNPEQAAAGFLHVLAKEYDFSTEPFNFSSSFHQGLSLIEKDVQTFTTTSIGRLFDTVAALLGFTRKMSFEGQAAIWLENLAVNSSAGKIYSFPNFNHDALLTAIIKDYLEEKPRGDIARIFIRSLALAIVEVYAELSDGIHSVPLVLSGGVFQNQLLCKDIMSLIQQKKASVELWQNLHVPPNDGGISLGQTALAVI